MRYEEADHESIALLEEVQKESFPHVEGAIIKLLFDTKARKRAGSIVLGEITKGNDLLRFFTKTEAKTLSGYDYVIAVDKMAWGGIGRADRVRILRHQLRHIRVDHEKPDPYMLVPHNVNDFDIEMDLNADDPQWAGRVVSVAEYAYKNQKAGLHPYQGTVPGAK